MIMIECDDDDMKYDDDDDDSDNTMIMLMMALNRYEAAYCNGEGSCFGVRPAWIRTLALPFVTC